jgi:HupE / UreJ protein
MNDFILYLQIGFEHIINTNGLDHILFVLALCLRYQLPSWKKLLVLITAFTIGHSLTLALSVFNFIHFSTTWIEFLIPLTIIITTINNVWVKENNTQEKLPTIYFLALFFGLIHGIGFSNGLKSMLGKTENIIPQLFAFNVGLEVGQLLIVSIAVAISFIFVTLFKINKRSYILFLSGGIAALALQMAIERKPF